tara:strand:- start:74 stop:730 length:657 start_codon:yes stop_codon:yes gene_type:complete
MKFFNNIDFEMNNQWGVVRLPWRDSFILFIDNVYKYPDRVYDYLTSIQCIRTHKSCLGSKNGIDFQDGQMSIDNRWDLNRKHLLELIANEYNIEIDTQTLPNTINQFRLISDFPGDGNYWHPHVDGQINFITFLNKTHNMKAGTSLYVPQNTKAKSFLMKKDTEHSNPWRTEKHFKEDLCILDRFNCGVAFPGDWFHGQTITDNFFKDSTRLTEVTFL